MSRKITPLIILIGLLVGTVVYITQAQEPAWQRLPFTDPRTGVSRTMSDFAGKTVVVETFATWCTNCRAQFGELATVYPQIDTSRVVYLALAIDPTEDQALVKRYIESNNFAWTFGVSSKELTTALVQQFGRTITNPPSVPRFLIRPDRTFTDLKTGFESGETILKVISDEAAKGPAATIEPSPAATESATEGATEAPTAAPTAAATTAVDRPEWQRLTFKDARSDKEYTFADFAGKTVIVEAFATWCPTCHRQFEALKGFYGDFDPAKVAYLALAIDPTEDDVKVAKYANDYGYPWLVVMSNKALTTALMQQFGRTITNPPSVPIFAIGPNGKPSELTTGLRGADDFKQLIADNS